MPCKVCSPLRSHQWIRTGVTVRKFSIRVKIVDFLSRVTFKFDSWPWKTTKHIPYTTSTYVRHFVAINELKLELQSKNAQFGSKLIFLSRVTFKFDRWLWKTSGHLSYAKSSFVHHFIAICEFKLELRSGNGQIGFWLFGPWPLTSDLDISHGHHVCHW